MVGSGSPLSFTEEGEFSNLAVALDTSGDPKAQAWSMNRRPDLPESLEFLGDYVADDPARLGIVLGITVAADLAAVRAFRWE